MLLRRWVTGPPCDPKTTPVLTNDFRKQTRDSVRSTGGLVQTWIWEIAAANSLTWPYNARCADVKLAGSKSPAAVQRGAPHS
jgi:hypothetical protein